MRAEFLNGFRHKTGVVHADRDGNSGRLDERHLETVTMDDIEYLAQALLQHKGKIGMSDVLVIIKKVFIDKK